MPWPVNAEDDGPPPGFEQRGPGAGARGAGFHSHLTQQELWPQQQPAASYAAPADMKEAYSGSGVAAGAARAFSRALEVAARQASPAGNQQAPAQLDAQSKALPAPDYGPYGNDLGDEYGTPLPSSRQRGGRAGHSSGHGSRHGSSSSLGRLPRSGSHRGLSRSAASSSQSLTPEPDSQLESDDHGSSRTPGGRRHGSRTDLAAAGISPAARGGRGRGRGGRRGEAGGEALSDQRARQLEEELAQVKAALQDAEEREVEQRMAVISLETDNSQLQTQLSSMRAQKQQLEQMLLFGEEPGQAQGSQGAASEETEESAGSLGCPKAALFADSDEPGRNGATDEAAGEAAVQADLAEGKKLA